ncbi:MAG: hypothetical protein R3F59_38020 [Myxococcota bacterium]
MLRGRHLVRTTWALPWRAVRRVLLETLDALAHAHARGCCAAT